MLKEEQIRPSVLFNKYLQLAKLDAENFKGERKESDCCLVCGSSRIDIVFSKNSFQYTECEACGSFMCNPRPNKEDIARLYANSESSRFWAEEFYPSVIESRRSLTIRPKVRELISMLTAHKIEPNSIIDVGSGHGVFAEELVQELDIERMICIEPSEVMSAELRKKGFEVIEKEVEEICGLQADLAICLEVFEHCINPCSFIKACSGCIPIGGHFFFTTLLGDGLDISVLRESSNAVFPPFHLNFATKQGLYILCEQNGLRVVELSTPGKLDVELLLKGIEERTTCRRTASQLSRLREIVDDTGLAALVQEKVVELNMSSHASVLCERID